MRILLYVLVILLWFVLGHFYKPCFENMMCNVPNLESSSDATIGHLEGQAETSFSNTKSNGSILFNWNSAEAILSEEWESRKKVIIEGLKDDEILEITGEYRAEETNNSSFKDLGMARASQISELIMPSISEDRIRIKGQLVKTNETDSTTSFKSVSFRNLKNTNAIKEIGK